MAEIEGQHYGNPKPRVRRPSVKTYTISCRPCRCRTADRATLFTDQYATDLTREQAARLAKKLNDFAHS